MIEINGKKFAKNNKELINTLFQGTQTAVGFYRPLKNKIKLFDLQNNLIGVINKHGVLVRAYKIENGKYWYNLAPIPQIGEFESYSKERENVHKVLEQCNVNRCNCC